MNYVCTFTDNNCIKNVIDVWLPTLKKNFSGKIVVISFNVAKEYLVKLETENVQVIQKELPKANMYTAIENRLEAQEEFINSLQDNDKIMLIDGADVVFQTQIDDFFDRIQDKIFYSTTNSLSNKITIKWLKRLLRNGLKKDYDFIMEKLPKTEIIASGMLAGSRKSLLEYLKEHKKTFNKSKIKYFTGINQAILTYLVIKNPEKFEKTDIHNCRILSPNVINENGIYKIHKTIPIVHFSCERQKQTYTEQYLNKNNDSSNVKPLKILWLYGSNHKFDKINHWYHLGFARILANKPNVNLMIYGYKMHQLHPDIAKIPFDEKKKGIDVKKEFDFDIVIMDNKNRFAFTQTLKDRKAKKPRHFWLKPEFFDGLDNIPKVFLEGDYHLHFRMGRPEEKDWYKKRKVDLLLVRHLTALDYHKDKTIPIQWFPCSVNDQIFKPNPNIKRKNKVCLISGYGINYYSYRNTAGKILEPVGLIDIYGERFIGDDYIKNLQSYICHLSGSSIRAITPAKMFEYMASGTLLLTDEGWEYGLKELFPDDTYVTYNKKTYYDLIPKVEKIINDKAFRQHTTKKALKCIKNKHTHEIRAQELLDIITKQFNITYKQPKNKFNLFGKINNLICNKNKTTDYAKIEATEMKPKITIDTKQEPKEESKIEKKIDVKKSLKQLYNKKIDICLLEDTCYNIIVNHEFGDKLKIAVSDQKKAKRLLGDNFVFYKMPNRVKKFIYEDMTFLVPCPIVTYLKTLFGDKVIEKLGKYNKKLKLIEKTTYKFKKRKKEK